MPKRSFQSNQIAKKVKRTCGLNRWIQTKGVPDKPFERYKWLYLQSEDNYLRFWICFLFVWFRLIYPHICLLLTCERPPYAFVQRSSLQQDAMNFRIRKPNRRIKKARKIWNQAKNENAIVSKPDLKQILIFHRSKSSHCIGSCF